MGYHIPVLSIQLWEHIPVLITEMKVLRELSQYLRCSVRCLFALFSRLQTVVDYSIIPPSFSSSTTLSSTPPILYVKQGLFSSVHNFTFIQFIHTILQDFSVSFTSNTLHHLHRISDLIKGEPRIFSGEGYKELREGVIFAF